MQLNPGNAGALRIKGAELDRVLRALAQRRTRLDDPATVASLLVAPPSV